MQLFWYVHTLRFLAFFISLISFVCHLSQCILLNLYQQKTEIPDWLTASHWQYLLWYISLGLSLVGGLTLCLSACYFKRPKKYTLDKCVGSLAVFPVLSSIITAMLFDSLEPWTNGLLKIERPSSSGLLTSCSLFDSSRDKFYPLLYQRCILSDSTWISSIIICIIWVLLVGLAIFASIQKNKETTAKNVIRPAVEPKWGRYIPDPPASIYSSTTLRSGLLTPPSKGHYYYGESVPNLPDYYPRQQKGGNYHSYEKDYYSDYKRPASNYSRDHRSPSASSSTYYYSTTPTTADYNYDYRYGQLARASTTHHNSPPATPSSYYTEEDRELTSATTTTISTPLYNSFASKSKNTRFNIRD